MLACWFLIRVLRFACVKDSSMDYEMIFCQNVFSLENNKVEAEAEMALLNEAGGKHIYMACVHFFYQNSECEY